MGKKAESVNNSNLRKKVLIILGVLFVGVLIAVIGIFFLINNKQYTVKYNTAGENIIEETKTDKKGVLKLPDTEPVKDNYKFNGWKYDNKYIFNNTIIHEDLELKADWLDMKYEYVQVILSPGVGFDNLVVYVEKDQRLIEPITPEKKDGEFKGWYLNNNEFNFDERIKEDIVLIGKWDDSQIISSADNKYYCFDSSFEIEDGKCKKEISINNDIEYYCSDGWELTDDNKCMMIDTTVESTNATPVYTCDNDYKLDGNKCSKEETVSATKKLYCSEGGLEGDACYDYSTKTMMSVNVCGYSSSQQDYVQQQKEKIQIYCMNNGGTLQTGCMWSCTKKQKNYLGDAKTKYTCSNGYKLNNGSCTGTKTISAKVEKYTCPEGHIASGAKCFEKSKAIKYEDIKEKKICKTGFELKDDKCTKEYSIDALKK